MSRHSLLICCFSDLSHSRALSRLDRGLTRNAMLRWPACCYGRQQKWRPQFQIYYLSCQSRRYGRGLGVHCRHTKSSQLPFSFLIVLERDSTWSQSLGAPGRNHACCPISGRALRQNEHSQNRQCARAIQTDTSDTDEDHSCDPGIRSRGYNAFLSGSLKEQIGSIPTHKITYLGTHLDLRQSL
jgi:hypothetical protein